MAGHAPASAAADTPGRRIVSILAAESKQPKIDVEDLGLQFAFRFVSKRLCCAPAWFPQGPRALGKFWTVDDVPPVDLLGFIKDWIQDNVPPDRRDAVAHVVVPIATMVLQIKMSDLKAHAERTAVAGSAVAAVVAAMAPPPPLLDQIPPPPPLVAVAASLPPAARHPLAPKSSNPPALPPPRLQPPAAQLGKRPIDDDGSSDSAKSKRPRPSSNPTTNSGTAAALSHSGNAGPGGGGGPKPDSSLSAIVLPGEETDGVKVYDTCADIRKKISAHMNRGGVTQAQFLRDLMAQYHTQNRRIQASQLARFRETKGVTMGNTSPVYYAAYVLFEKMRIKEGRKKSSKREEMEKIHPDGMDITRRNTGYYFCGPGERPHEDQYGRVTFS